MRSEYQGRISKTLDLLDQHYEAFFAVAEIATETGHPVPTDTRGWSQIIVSVLTGTKGLARRKGPDLEDGSDVKGANTWEAIDTPRFNGVIKAGTKAQHSDKLEYLDRTPFLFLVLWDVSTRGKHRCRIWVVRPGEDAEFRTMCDHWYAARSRGRIMSTNFQLHPPRGRDSNMIRNTFGNLQYPLLLSAERGDDGFEVQMVDVEAMRSGLCTPESLGTS